MRTVQGVLEDALAGTLRLAEPPTLTVAGRTDAGVHARGQVAHLDVAGQSWTAAAPAALRPLNRGLPPDVRGHATSAAPAGFAARVSAPRPRCSCPACDTD